MRLIVICALAVTATAAQARIGETEAELAARYGKPLKATPAKAVGYAVFPYRMQSFGAQGISIVVEFGNARDKRNGESAADRSVSESYSAAQDFTPAAINSLLESNKGASKWVAAPTEVYSNKEVKTWVLADGTRRARLYREGTRQTLKVQWVDVTPVPQGF